MGVRFPKDRISGQASVFAQAPRYKPFNLPSDGFRREGQIPRRPFLPKPWGYAGSVSHEITVAAAIKVLITFVLLFMCPFSSTIFY